MTLLTAENISKRFNDQIILDKVSFSIESGERIALVGRNGIGKTTLLEMMAGKQSVDSGQMRHSRQCLIDYIEQEKREYLHHTLMEFVAGARSDLHELKQKIDDLEYHLQEFPHDKKAVQKLGLLHQQFEQDGGFSFDNEVKTILTGLGFPGDRFNERLNNFSGGEKNRAGLARLLAGRGNLLLLDEPTNHLDIESTTWLEEYLIKLDKACLIVSHDRSFLTATSKRIWEISFGKIETYTGGIEKYLVERAERFRLAEHRYRHQQEEIKRIEEYIRRNMAGQKTKQAQSKLKFLGRIKRLPPPGKDRSGPTITINSSGRSFAHLLSIEDLTLAYGDRIIIEQLMLDIYRGDKIGLIGRNGTGKSTLLRALIGELAPVKGSISLGDKVNVAYFNQELSDLNESSTVLDNLWELDTSAEAGKIRSFLARFGFSGDEALKRVISLSGGEKTKLSLARLLYHPANFVILDEPTNHLDMQAREELEKALREYDGSCLIVSHDRYFLNQVVDKILYIKDSHATLYNGNYEEFIKKQQQTPLLKKTKEKSNKQDYKKFKEESKRRARHKKQIENTRLEINQSETELVNIENNLIKDSHKDDWEKLHALTEDKQHMEGKIIELYLALEKLEEEKEDD